MALFSATQKGTTNHEQQLAVKLTGNEPTVKKRVLRES
jgi:hypothetical protein